LIAVVVASLIMYFPLMVLNQGNINAGGIGFGDRALSAPQAGLMASLAQGIVGGNMAWPLVIAGMLMGVALIMIRVKSPMLVAIGMYLPISITSAIFVGGVIRWVADAMARRARLNDAQKARMENVGVLAASGMIAGEALAGIVTATFQFERWPIPQIFKDPTYLVGIVFMALIAWILIKVPLDNAGDPDEPAPPVAIV
jgi:putative OPT family oligopeptide transporter